MKSAARLGSTSTECGLTAINNRCTGQPGLNGRISSPLEIRDCADVKNQKQKSCTSFIGFSEILEKKMTHFQMSGLRTGIQRIGNEILAYLRGRLDFENVDSGRLDLLYGGSDCRKETGPFDPLLSIAIKDNQVVIDCAETLSPSASCTGNVTEVSDLNRCLHLLSLGPNIRVTAELVRDAVNPEMFTLTLSIRDREFCVGGSENETQENDSRRYGGTGLGLYLTKRLLEEMQERVRVKSSTVGQGNAYASTFILRGSGSAVRDSCEPADVFAHQSNSFWNFTSMRSGGSSSSRLSLL